MDKKYQIFISSTYKDLIEERTKVIQTILGLEQIPTGMEGFPAIDEEQFTYIKKIIDYCDYYVLIVAGKYGSISPIDGLSYTEKEFNYAVGEGMKVCAFLYDDIKKLPYEKVEDDPELAKKLNAFRNRIEHGKFLYKKWINSDDLCTKVSQSLIKTFNEFPSNGWIKDFPIISQHPKYYLNLKSNLKQLTQKVTNLNHDNKRYPLLIYDWIIRNKISKTQDEFEDTITLQVLNPGEKIRQIFGGIITNLQEGDNYHTLSTLSFWIKDLETSELKFIEDNLNAIHNKVKIERIIIIENEMFEIPYTDKNRLRELEQLVKTFLKLIAEDERNFSQIQTTFVSLSKDEINELQDIPLAIIFSNIKIDQKKNQFKRDSINNNTSIMQITSSSGRLKSAVNTMGLNVSFLSERNSAKLFNNEAKFLRLKIHPSKKTIFEMHSYLNALNDECNFKIDSNKNKYVFSIYNSTYRIIECNFKDDSSKLKFKDALINIAHKDTSSHTVIDELEKINDAISKQEIVVILEQDKITSRDKHPLKLFKIEVIDAINRYGVISKISKNLSDKSIPICIFTVYDGVYLLVQSRYFNTVLNLFHNDNDYEFGTVEGNPM